MSDSGSRAEMPQQQQPEQPQQPQQPESSYVVSPVPTKMAPPARAKSEAEAKLPTGITVSYLTCIPIVQRVARSLGYNIAVHGSVRRDLDLIAVPWEETACAPEKLVTAICEAVEGFIKPDEAHEIPRVMAHGRLCFPIWLNSKQYIDLSVIPPLGAAREASAGALSTTMKAGWNPNTDGAMPQGYDVVDLLFRDGDVVARTPVAGWIWTHSGEGEDIVGWRGAACEAVAGALSQIKRLLPP